MLLYSNAYEIKYWRFDHLLREYETVYGLMILIMQNKKVLMNTLNTSRSVELAHLEIKNERKFQFVPISQTLSLQINSLSNAEVDDLLSLTDLCMKK